MGDGGGVYRRGRRRRAAEAEVDEAPWESGPEGYSDGRYFTSVHIGLGEPIHQASFRRGERPETGGGVEPLQGERPARTVANEPLETRSVLGLDADGAIDREPPGALPRAHVRRRRGVQESAPCEPPGDAKLHRARQGLRVPSLEAGGLVEADSPLDVAGDHTVESEHMVVGVGV